MNEAVLQALLILVYLAIGLISVTFPIYAISVNFLPQQKWENEKERKKRMDELKTKISELTAQLGGQAPDTETKLKEQLDKYQAEKEGTELRYQYLTAWGAVGIPVVALVLALLCAVFGIYGFYKNSREGAIGLGVLSAMSSVVALYRLYKTISAVEYGALRPERTVEFTVGFGSKYQETEKISINKEAQLRLFMKTEECDIEDVVLDVYFSSKLKVTSDFDDPNIIASTYSKGTAVRMYHNYLPKSMGIGLNFSATPNEIGKCPVRVTICAKGLYETKKELTVEVV